MKRQFRAHVSVKSLSPSSSTSIITDGTGDIFDPLTFEDRDIEYEEYLQHQDVTECVADMLDFIEVQFC